MKKTISICSGIVLLLCSCGAQKESQLFQPEEEIAITHSSAYSLETAGVLNPEYLQISDKVLVIVEESGEPLVKILSLQSEPITAWGCQGRGPNEFLQITSVDLFSQADTLRAGLYDASRKRYVEVSSAVDSAGRSFQEVWASDKNFDVITRLSDGTYVGAAVFDSSRFYLLDVDARILDKTNNFPPKPDGFPLLSHSMACSGILVAAPNRPVFASSVAYDGGIDVCVTRNGKIEPLWRFSLFDMDYDILSEYHHVPTPNSDSRQGYMSLSFSNNYLYALYSGRKMLDDSSEMCDEIHVFDYQGKHCKRYSLDRKIYTLAVDTEDSRLYGLTRDPEGYPILVSYILN